MLWRSTLDVKLIERCPSPCLSHRLLCSERATFPGGDIQDRERAECRIMGQLIGHKIEAPRLLDTFIFIPEFVL